MNSVRGVVLGCLLASATGLVLAAEPQRAVWREHEFDFTYMGFTTQYSCDGLKHKVQQVLMALGARENPVIRATGCEIGGGVAVAPRVHVRVAFPEIVTGGDTRDGSFAVAPASARISPQAGTGIAMGDCELVEQLADRVLPALGIVPAMERTGCVPHQLGLGRPMLEAPVPKPVPQDP